MAHKILVIDRNEAFATMLKETLEIDGGYQVNVAASGSDALNLLDQNDFALTIVDMDQDTEDMGYQELIRNIRQSQPTMRLVVIPLMGEDLPPEAHTLDIQGSLAKPFFVDDLLPSIKEALDKEVKLSPPTVVREKPASGGVANKAHAVLSELAYETQAEAVLLFVAGAQPQIVAHVSTLSETGVKMLAGLSLATLRAAQGVARLLAQPDVPFEHNMFENESSRLYIMTLPANLALVIITPIHTPLGTIRHNLRRAGRELGIRTLT
jgi:CheY-like chemotaxis protein/predicted regulator of Ras-like GTPase activity (Roadblock/LC7/MglB family)